jgi:hypothetical protein
MLSSRYGGPWQLPALTKFHENLQSRYSQFNERTARHMRLANTLIRAESCTPPWSTCVSIFGYRSAFLHDVVLSRFNNNNMNRSEPSAKWELHWNNTNPKQMNPTTPSVVPVPVWSRIFFPPHRQDRLWGPPNVLSNGYRGGSFPGSKPAGVWSWPLTSS